VNLPAGDWDSVRRHSGRSLPPGIHTRQEVLA
jgi:hypothetical protein